MLAGIFRLMVAVVMRTAVYNRHRRINLLLAFNSTCLAISHSLDEALNPDFGYLVPVPGCPDCPRTLRHVDFYTFYDPR